VSRRPHLIHLQLDASAVGPDLLGEPPRPPEVGASLTVGRVQHAVVSVRTADVCLIVSLDLGPLAALRDAIDRALAARRPEAPPAPD
jgi:hypothetical protein